MVDAVRCAVEIQRRWSMHNAGIAGAQRIEFRIGINLGDMIIEGDDIFGDGVNVAARLEGLAEPGGVCVADVRLPDGPGPSRPRVRGSWRAAGQEHRRAGAGMAVD